MILRIYSKEVFTFFTRQFFCVTTFINIHKNSETWFWKIKFEIKSGFDYFLKVKIAAFENTVEAGTDNEHEVYNKMCFVKCGDDEWT